jgi:hypothetical protein
VCYNPDASVAITNQYVDETAAAFAVALSDFCLRVGATDATDFIDNVEAYLAKLEQQECPVQHHWFDGLYSRECFIPGGTICVTDTHETTHPLFLMRGIISVWTKENGVVTIHAPAAIKTTPGTRRIFYTHTDTVGITVHATNETDPELIRKQITSQRVNPLRALS